MLVRQLLAVQVDGSITAGRYTLLLSRPLSRLVAVVLCLAVELAGPIAMAQNVDHASRVAASTLSEAGIKLFHAGLYPQANDTFAKAYSIAPLPSIGLWQARTLAKLNRQVDAFERLRDVMHLTLSPSDPASEKKAQADAAAELQVLTRQLPSLTIQVKGAAAADVRVSLDGQPIATDLLSQPQRVNPGAHHLEAVRLSDRVSTQSDINVKIGEQSTAVLQFVGNASGAGQLPVAVPYSTPAAATGTSPGQTLTGSNAPLNQGVAASRSGQTTAPATVPAAQGNSAIAPAVANNAEIATQTPGQPGANASARALAISGGLLPLTIEPDPRATAPAVPASSPKRSSTNALVGYGTLGTGIASLIVGVGAYAAALEKKDTLASSPNCNDTRCNGLERSNVDSYNQFRTAAIIGLLGGAALVTTGVVTLNYPSQEKSERKVALDIGPMSAAVRGDF